MMKMNGHKQVLAMVLALLALVPQWGEAKKETPDFTKGAAGKKNQVWNLGPTDIIAYHNGNDSKQFLVKEARGPANKVLIEQDVIIGVGTKKFRNNGRAELTAAITEAEKEENGGKLALLIFRPKMYVEEIKYTTKGDRDKVKKGWLPTHRRVYVKPFSGEEMTVTLTLPVLGTYSETAPARCPKTRAIIDKAVEAITKNGLGDKGGIPDSLRALGLLATGEEKYLPMIREYARKQAPPDKEAGGGGWTGSYQLIFLTEYYLATKDEYVLPFIKKQARYFGRGVSGVGTWSHGMGKKTDAQLYGPPGAYGAMNQVGITLTMSMVLAQKCGVQDKYVNEAVKRSLNFLRYFVEKGTIPYGDHGPAEKHDNNGRNSQAAVLFDLVNDKEAATFFTRMTLASYPLREIGHTGPFFSQVWGALGAARGGPWAAISFIKNTRYYTELERRSDGRSYHQYKDKYTNWDTTGARLLQHCLPRRKLFITGKGGSSVDRMTKDEVKTFVAAATFNPKPLSVEQLLEALGSWSLVVRSAAAEELGKRNQNVVKELIAMLDSPNPFARYGAAVGLRHGSRNSAEAAKALVNIIKDKEENGNMKFYAARGLVRMKRVKNGFDEKVLMPAAPVLLELAAELDSEDDPYGKLSAQLLSSLSTQARSASSRGLFPGGQGIEQMDSDLVVKAMKAWLSNPNGGTRSGASKWYGRLSKEQLDKLWREIYLTAAVPAPSGVMFAGEGRANSTIFLAKHRFKEALPLALEYTTVDGWGKFGRVPAGFEALSYFGSAVKPHMEILEFEHKRYQKRKKSEVANENKKWAMLMNNIDKDIPLRSIKPYLQEGDER